MTHRSDSSAADTATRTMRHDNRLLGWLLHLSDPTLPIGGFNHSGGLETFIQQKAVHDADSLRRFAVTQLRQNWRCNDGAYLVLSFDAAGRNDLPALLALDEQIAAAKMPRELRESSFKLGVRLLKIFTRYLDGSLLHGFQTALHNRQALGFYPLIFGMLAALMRLDKEQALYAFYYNQMVGLVTNGVKLIPLGQLAGQDILFGLQTEIAETVSESLRLNPDELGAAASATEIRAMQHEYLYSRLYMS